MSSRPTRRAALVAAFAIATGVGAVAVSAPALASDTTQTASSSVGAPKAGETITVPSGKQVKLSKDFSQYTVSELTAIGAGPGQSSTSTPLVTKSSGGGVTTQSASNSSGYVTINVDGQGRTVNNVTAVLSRTAPSKQTYAIFWENDKILETGQSIYHRNGTTDATFSQHYPFTYGKNIWLYTSYAGFDGKPGVWVYNR